MASSWCHGKALQVEESAALAVTTRSLGEHLLSCQAAQWPGTPSPPPSPPQAAAFPGIHQTSDFFLLHSPLLAAVTPWLAEMENGVTAEHRRGCGSAGGSCVVRLALGNYYPLTISQGLYKTSNLGRPSERRLALRSPSTPRALLPVLRPRPPLPTSSPTPCVWHALIQMSILIVPACL